MASTPVLLAGSVGWPVLSPRKVGRGWGGPLFSPEQEKGWIEEMDAMGFEYDSDVLEEQEELKRQVFVISCD